MGPNAGHGYFGGPLGSLPMASRRFTKMRLGPVRQRLVQRFYPVPYREGGRALQMGLAADVGREYGGGLSARQGGDLVVPQLVGKLRLEDRVGARRAAAEMGVGDG